MNAWTDALPTEPGWYWFSYLSREGGDRLPPRMIELQWVTLPRRRLVAIIRGAICFDVDKRPDQPSGRPNGCLWAGPLKCPELPS